MHGSAHESVDKNRACFFVNLVFDRVGIHGNFNDHIEFMWRVFAGVDVI
jgi:hypothetical protein